MTSEQVSKHYSVGDLAGRIFAALEAQGADLDALTIDDLASIDAFHIRGRAATEELAAHARIGADDHVLDAGSGIGGASRFLAATTGCRVTGVDLTAEYVDVARQLTDQVGLAGLVEFQQGSVLDLPFDDAEFDAVWTEHVQMNIAGKKTFYGELHRVLKPGGRLAFHDIFAGPEPGLLLPVPWASDAAISHLISIEELRGVLAAAGFSQRIWEDKTAASTAFFAERAVANEAAGGPPVGLHVLMEEPALKFANVLENLRQGRICVVQALMKKRADAAS